ncbi:MAG: IS66 family insertion sequence element accessory protein TnpB [Isosphaeraceae bacterium]|nr:IS66 family insertion sequence element accessory protein TnpB [Isosphaeraceae bacterium]
MITSNPGTEGVRVWVATRPVDMRKGFDGLAEVVRTFLGHDPLSGSLFVFRNRSAQRVKILWYDRDGLAIYYKRLERGTFRFPAGDDEAMAIDSGGLLRLLSGMTVVATRSA